MKKVYRYEDNRDYWDRRWSEAGSDLDMFLDVNMYPIAYANRVVIDRSEQILELGCGLGRVLKHFHYNGYTIAGLERSLVAVERLHNEDPSLDVKVGDVRNLPYEDEEFGVVLAFGLYHNIEAVDDIQQALRETARCLKPGGRFCISMRPNNLEMRANEWYWRWKHRSQRSEAESFHKWLVTKREFARILAQRGLHADEVHRARNMSILYRIPALREQPAEESVRRANGYRLNDVGRAIDHALIGALPSQFCNVLVYIGRKR